MRRFEDYLGSGDALRRLNQEARRLAELDRAYRQALPEALAEASGVSHLDAGTLFLWADGGAVAAKLRQLTPMVLAKLRQRAPECTAIRVTVLVSGRQALHRSGARPRIGGGGVEALRGLASSLPPSPLKAALSRLAARGLGRSENGE
jgi:hypothetical protein